MTIDKAIENLTDYVGEKREVPYDELLESCQLGIGALKRVMEQRALEACERKYLLPGETKDE